MVCIYAFYIVYGCCFAIHRCSYTIDSLLAPSIQQELVQSLQDPAHKFLSAAALSTVLSAHCSAIERVDIELIAPNVRHCTIKAHNPLCRINNDALVTDTGYLLPTALFAEHRLRNLYTIAMVKPPLLMQQCDPQLLSFVRVAIPQLVTQFSITWHDAFTIEMQDRKNQPCFLLTTAGAKLHPSLLHTVASLHAQELQRDQKQKHKKYIADIRFDNQIIMRVESKGGVHG